MEKTTTEPPDPLDSDEAIFDLADYLSMVESSEELAELQQVEGITPDRLREACKLLPPSKIALIKEFAIINYEKRSKAN